MNQNQHIAVAMILNSLLLSEADTDYLIETFAMYFANLDKEFDKEGFIKVCREGRIQP